MKTKKKKPIKKSRWSVKAKVKGTKNQSITAGLKKKIRELQADIRRLKKDVKIDGPVFNSGRSEGKSDVAADLRKILDPGDVNHLNLEGLLEMVKLLLPTEEEKAALKRSTSDNPVGEIALTPPEECKLPAPMPKKGDKEDKRCAFTGADSSKKHLPVTEEDWCHGCDFYICDNCDSPFGVPGIGKHDVTAHELAREENAEDEDEGADS